MYASFVAQIFVFNAVATLRLMAVPFFQDHLQVELATKRAERHHKSGMLFNKALSPSTWVHIHYITLYFILFHFRWTAQCTLCVMICNVCVYLRSPTEEKNARTHTIFVSLFQFIFFSTSVGRLGEWSLLLGFFIFFLVVWLKTNEWLYNYMYKYFIHK